MHCPFCKEAAAKSTTFPVIVFNRKEFRYIRCVACKLVYLDRFPDADDYNAMYPPSYQQNGVEAVIVTDPFVKLPGLRFSYGYQFELIRKFAGGKANILDHGCGNGHFLANALHQGFTCDGSEYNPEYIPVLETHFTNSRFYTIEQVLAAGFDRKYNVIRLSNVLEHLTEPLEVIRQLSKCLAPGGIMLVEGPVEENFSLAAAFRKFYFRIAKLVRPRRTVTDPPYHILLSDARNQRQFFKDCGLTELHYAVAEDPWPFPASLQEAKGLQQKISWLIGRLSLSVTRLIGKGWGNIFIYAGKKDTE
jgi:SAM-dependent methyltransferase